MNSISLPETPPELYSLIRTLTPSEKRAYRRYAGQHSRNGKNNYLTLFELLESMETWSPEILAKKLKRHRFTSHYPPTQLKLLKNLLKYLRNSTTNPDRDLKDAIDEIRILIRRGLYKTAKKRHRKAVEQARAREKYLILLELADLERNLFFRTVKKGLISSLDEAAARDLAWLGCLEEQIQLNQLTTQAYGLAKIKYSPGEKNQDPQLSSIESKLVEVEPETLLSDTARLSYFNLLGLTELRKGNHESAFEHYEALMQLWQKKSELGADLITHYLPGLTNFLNACLFQGKFEVFENTLAEMKALPLPNPFDQIRFEENLLYLELIFYLNTTRFEQGIAMGDRIETYIKTYPNLIPPSKVIIYFFNLTSLHFLKGDFSGALKWTNRIINETHQEFRKDIRNILRVLRLVMHLEKGDWDLMEYLLRATKRFFNDQTLPMRIDKRLLKLLSDYQKTGDKGVFHSDCKKMRVALDKDLATRKSPPPIGFTEVYCWLESKETGRPLTEIFREKVGL